MEKARNTTRKERKGSRKKQILHALAQMLEINLGERITTSELAKKVGVSEAALYRHFPSKAKMFEGLIEFIEEVIFTRITLIIKERQTALDCCYQFLTLLLAFCEKNPGLTRILNGDALAGETERLRLRIVQLFDRLETQLRQILRDAEIHEGLRTRMTQQATANLLLAVTEGRISQYVRSGFKRKPTHHWAEQWECLCITVFR